MVTALRAGLLSLTCCLAASAALPEGAGIDLKRLDRVCIPGEPVGPERSMADLLVGKLEVLYGVKAEVVKGQPEGGQGAILLGRKMALASGMMTQEDLAGVKYDGYVMKGQGDRVALAGYAPQGTIYATYAFLRRIGLKLYPWRNFNAVEVHEPLKDGALEPFVIASKPFFARRSLLGWLDRGRWGASLLEYSLGDFRFCQKHPYFEGKGWLGADHSAPYLVPMAVHYDDHPEYYAMKGGKRIPKDTKNMRVAICMSNPQVHRIAIERALEWMELQKQRRFFHITDGDTSECQCPECVAMDPVPRSYTDRYLKWVNSVARAVKEKFPDSVMLPLAYGRSTHPPVEVRPESNAVVMYCPWYWNSRSTSAVTWASPLNITAMKEFMAWTLKFPDQMGLYDYPGSWVHGQADRIKFLAKNKSRVFYSCGGNGDLFQWVNARLLWDPFLDTEKLIDEFVRAYYGTAAEPMRTYLRLRQVAIETRCAHTRDFFGDAAFVRKTRQLMARAEELARAADDRTQSRILTGVLDGLHLVLQKTHPRTGASGLRNDAVAYRRDLEQYVRLSERLLGVYGRLNNKYVVRTYKGGFRKAISRLALKLPEGDKEEDLFAQTLALLDDQLKEAADLEKAEETPKTISISFAPPDETEKWLSDGSQAQLISPPAQATVAGPSGEGHTGVRISAPLSKLPVAPHHKIRIHAGRFYAERVFDPPIDATGCFFLDFHVHASADVPITIYVNNVHSDVDLHAGEQIVRIDFRNYRHARFNWEIWDKKIHRVGFDIWPQDNYYPYPEVCDADLVFISMTATNQKPVPSCLPHKGSAIWLSQYRPNIKRGVALPRDQYDQYLQRQHFKHVGLDYGFRWINERFRTFTEHRAVTPIFAILTAPEPSRAEREAAENLQTHLHKAFGVRLPVNPEGLEAGRTTGNVILLGKGACLAGARVKETELKHIGPEGSVINAHNGRIAIAGADDSGTAYGIVRYLEDHRLRFFGPDRSTVPDLRKDLLHELYLLDWPYFKERPIRGGWQLKTSHPSKPADAPGTVADAQALAEAIKNVARAGKGTLPPSLVKEANSSTLLRYVAANLAWDPFMDASRLIRRFSRPSQAR